MILGRVAVGALIFAVTIAIQIGIIRAWIDDTAVDMTGWGCILTLILATYCTVSGLWLLIHFGYI